MKTLLLLPAIALIAMMNSSEANGDLVAYDFAAGSVAQSTGGLLGSDVTFGPFTGGNPGTAAFPSTAISGASGGPFVRTTATGATTNDGDSLTDAITNNNFLSFTVTNNTSDDYSLDDFTYNYGFDDGFPALGASTTLFSSVDGFTSGAELGTNSIAVAGSGFSQAIPQTLRTVDVSSLGDIAPSESIEFRLYFVDASTGGNRIHRTSNFELTGTVVQVPEPSSIALLGLGGVAMLIRRRK